MSSRQIEANALMPSHNVARYCRPRDISHGRISRDAFLLRSREQFLSTNWLEHFHESDRMIQISGVRNALSGKGFRVNRNGRLAVLNVGVTHGQVSDRPLRFIRLGTPGDPSHTGIFGYTPGDYITAAALAYSVSEEYSAIP